MSFTIFRRTAMLVVASVLPALHMPVYGDHVEFVVH